MSCHILEDHEGGTLWVGSLQVCGTLQDASCEPAVYKLDPQCHHSPQCLRILLMIGWAQILGEKNYQNMICGVNTTKKGFLAAFKSSFPFESQRHDLETGRSLELFFNFSLNWLTFKYAEHSIIYQKNQFCSNQDLSQVFLYHSSVNFSCFSWVLSLFPSHL